MSVAVALLDWRNFRREHQSAVQAFQCTTPAKPHYEQGRGKIHPLPYELEVQSYIRGLRIPADGTSIVRLGFRDGELRAVLCMSCIQEHLVGQDHPDSMLHIQAVAVDVRHKLQGYGHHALTEAIRLANTVDRKYLPDSELTPTPLIALIHASNTPSQQLFIKNGFVYDGHHADGLHQWIKE